MSRFRYRAAQADGRVISGTIAAETENDATAILHSQGLHPITLLPALPGLFQKKASPSELAIVFRSISTLFGAGVPLERALAASDRLSRNPRLQAAIREARRLLTEGLRLSDALARGEAQIPPVVIGVLRAGERGGRLGAALEQAATQLEREAALASRIRQALAYPLILLVAGAASVVVIATVVIPRFAVILADLGQSLPPTTRLLMATASFIRAFGVWIAFIGIGAAVAFLGWVRSPEGRLAADGFLLGLPVLGRMRHGFASARVGRALGALLGAGVPILTAMETAREAAGDAEVGSRLARSARRVAEGETMTVALRSEQALTPTAFQVISVGDSIGQLDVMALRAGDLAAAEAEGALNLAVSFLEPALVLAFGVVVAFTAAALLQAVYSLRPG